MILGIALSAVLIFAVFLVAQEIGNDTIDERAHEIGYRATLSFAVRVLSGETDLDYTSLPIDMEYYGLLPVAPAIWVSDVVSSAYGFGEKARLDLYRLLLHFNALLWGVGTVFLFFNLISMLTGDRMIALVGAIFLLLFPVWLGQSFFNYKDLAWAFFYLLGLYGSLKAIAPRHEIGSALVLLTIATLGAATVKFAALPLMSVQWLTVTLSAVASDRPRRMILKVAAAALLVAVGAYALTPQAWLDPLNYAVDDVTYMSHHPWPGCMMTKGQCVFPALPGWSALAYLFDWFGVRLPLFILVSIGPCALYLAAFGKLTDRLLIVAAALPLLLIVVGKAHVYDGVRHVLFVIPPLFAIAFVCVAKVRSVGRYSTAGWLFLMAAIANIGFFIVDNITLFPYNYVYFNEVMRDYARPDKYDLDYWGFSLKEARRKYEAIATSEEQNVDDGPRYLNVQTTRGNYKPPSNCKILARVERTLMFSPNPLLLATAALCEK